MQKFSINRISFDEIDVFGFDLDGTLYDEFEFISQSYYPVARFISNYTEKSSETEIISYMKKLWLEFGSSKRDLFQDAAQHFGAAIDKVEIEKCVALFRNAPFSLDLPKRIAFILSEMEKTGKMIFLLSDGDPILQRRKIEKLGLSRWFSQDRVFISGDYGKEYQKPNSRILTEIERVIDIHSNCVCYIGDRDVDRLFSINVGFMFLYSADFWNAIKAQR